MVISIYVICYKDSEYEAPEKSVIWPRFSATSASSTTYSNLDILLSANKIGAVVVISSFFLLALIHLSWKSSTAA